MNGILYHSQEIKSKYVVIKCKTIEENVIMTLEYTEFVFYPHPKTGLLTFRERRRKGEREGEKHQCDSQTVHT